MMLQRFCTRFHHVASVTCATNLTSSVNPLLSTPIRLFHSPTSLTTASLLTLSRFPVKRPTFLLPSPFSPHSQVTPMLVGFLIFVFILLLGIFLYIKIMVLLIPQINVRWKTKVTRARAPYTPVKSKKHKYKIKGYSYVFYIFFCMIAQLERKCYWFLMFGYSIF